MDVSVIIPTFNRAHLLPHTLDAILAQTHRPTDIIVVDDGSTDSTPDVVCQRYPQVRYERMDNAGVCRARNIGVGLARTRWIAFCDSDDLWRPNMLATHERILKAAPEVEYCFTNFVHVTNNVWGARTKFDDLPARYWDGLPVAARAPEGFVINAPLFERLLWFQPIFQSTLLMTKAFFHRIGGFDERFGRVPAEDFEFTLRCAQELPIGVVTQPVVGIRRHEGNFSRHLPRTLAGEAAILEHAIRRHRAATTCRAYIEAEVTRRRIAAFDAAFSRGERTLAVDLAPLIPQAQRSAKLRAKHLAARVPGRLGVHLCGLLTRMREVVG